MTHSRERLDTLAELLASSGEPSPPYTKALEADVESKELSLFATDADFARWVGSIEGKLVDMPTKSWVWNLMVKVGLAVATLLLGIFSVIGFWLRSILAILDT